jgi:hypothetical protein
MRSGARPLPPTPLSRRYVRREVRALTDADRWRYLSALRTVHTLSDREGRRLYGERFTSAKRLAALHNAEDVCYHFGRQFWTAHPAFNLALERSLQAIDARIAAPYWDFLADAAEHGAHVLSNSRVFANDFFGSASYLGENDYVVADGPFAYVEQAWDEAGAWANWTIENAYLSAVTNSLGRG